MLPYILEELCFIFGRWPVGADAQSLYGRAAHNPYYARRQRNNELVCVVMLHPKDVNRRLLAGAFFVHSFHSHSASV